MIMIICAAIAGDSTGSFVVSLAIWSLVCLIVEFLLMSYGYTVLCFDHRLVSGRHAVRLGQ